MFEISCPLPPYLTYPIPPTINILKYHGLLDIINEPILTHYQLRPIIYPYFISIYLIVFLFRIPSYVTHYIIYCFPYLPISFDSFQNCFVFDDFESFEHFWPDILVNDPQFECMWCLIVIIKVLWVCRWMTTKAKCCFHHILLSSHITYIAVQYQIIMAEIVL